MNMNNQCNCKCIFLTSGLNLWRFNIQLANVKVPENMYVCGHEMTLLLRLSVG